MRDKVKGLQSAGLPGARESGYVKRTMPTEKIACANEPCECMVEAQLNEDTGGEPGEAYCNDDRRQPSEASLARRAGAAVAELAARRQRIA